MNVKPLIVMLACTAAACDADPAPVWPVRSDSAGVETVRWGATDVALDWTFEPVLDLTAPDGPAAFGRVMPSGVGVDGVGTIHVLDVLNFRIVVFDSAGNLLRTDGRSGSGPGEFRFPSDLGVRSDGARAVYDFDRRAFVVLDPAGEPLEEVAAPGPLMRRVAFTRFGIAGAFRFEGAGDTATIRLLLLDPGAAGATTLASVSELPLRQVDLGCATMGFRPLLGPTLTWSAAGDRIAGAAGTAYTIEIFEGSRLAARWSRDLPPLSGTTALAARALGGDTLRVPGGCRLATPEAAERIGYADAASRIADITVSPAGEIWVSRRDRNGDTVTDVWSADGGYSGTLSAGSPFPAAFQGDRIVTVERDSLGVQIVRLWRIGRS